MKHPIVSSYFRQQSGTRLEYWIWHSIAVKSSIRTALMVTFSTARHKSQARHVEHDSAQCQDILPPNVLSARLKRPLPVTIPLGHFSLWTNSAKVKRYIKCLIAPQHTSPRGTTCSGNANRVYRVALEQWVTEGKNILAEWWVGGILTGGSRNRGEG